MKILDKLTFYTYHKSFISKKMKKWRSSYRELEKTLNKES